MYKSYKKHVMEFGEENTEIDRIDFNGNYSKHNCRWVTLQEQANNKRDNVFILYKGKTMTVAQWAKKLNMKYITLYTRLKRYSVEKSFTKSLRTWPGKW